MIAVRGSRVIDVSRPTECFFLITLTVGELNANMIIEVKTGWQSALLSDAFYSITKGPKCLP